jgi:4-amino-4-deoxy-L-arabinose transferase-like glycosyltransferase
VIPLFALAYRLQHRAWPAVARGSSLAAASPPTPTPFLLPAALCAGLAALLVAVMNFITSILTAPHNGDSLTFLLPRMAYYLQFGSLSWYPAVYWAQLEHPKVAAILNMVFFLASDRDESLTQLAQFLAYGFNFLIIYRLSRTAGINKLCSFLGGSIFLLSIDAPFESTTNQNDLLVLLFLASSLYFSLLYVFAADAAWLLLSAVALGLSAGTKASTFLLFPPAMVVLLAAAYVTWKRGRPLRSIAGSMLALAIAALVGGAAIALPSGYAENLAHYGHFLGDDAQVISVHTNAHLTWQRIGTAGMVNLARFSVNLMRLDGFPDRGLSSVPAQYMAALVKWAGIDLNSPDAPSRMPVDFSPKALSSVLRESDSYPGPVVLFLAMPALLLGVVVARRSVWFWAFFVAAGVFVVVQSFCGPYDSWRGRYFVSFVFFAAPAAAIVLNIIGTRSLPAAMVLVLVAVCGISAVFAVVFRSDGPFPRVLSLDRLTQMTQNYPPMRTPIAAFEEIVPEDAVVTSVLPGSVFEYPFFGRSVTRYLIPGGEWPANPSVADGRKSQFVVYTAGSAVSPLGCDIDLGESLWLRDQRTCGEPPPGNLFQADLRSRAWAPFGWSRPESWGVWSDGPVAGAVLPTSADLARLAADPRLIVEARGFSPAGKPQSVEVLINGRAVATWTFQTDDGFVRKEAVIPRSLLAAHGASFRLEFHLRDPISPHDLTPENADSRRLGIGVRLIQLASAT